MDVPGFLSSPQALLAWLAGPGINIVAGGGISLLVEFKAQWYQNLPSFWKRYIFLVFCLIVPVLATVVSCMAGYKPWNFADVFFPAIVAGGMAFASGTSVHGVVAEVKRRNGEG